MLWNEFDYDIQTEVLSKIQTLIKKEHNLLLKRGIVAALNELETWSNSPCQEDIGPYPKIVEACEYMEVELDELEDCDQYV
jgi:hypothetical protein